MTKGEAIEIITKLVNQEKQEYEQMAQLQGCDYSLMQKQIEAITYALAVLERVSDVETLEQIIGSFESESSDTFPKELAQAIVKEVLGEK